MKRLGMQALAESGAVVSRRAEQPLDTHAGVVKALPFSKLGGTARSSSAHRQSRLTSRLCGTPLPHVIDELSTRPHRGVLGRRGWYGYGEHVILSPGHAIRLRMTPMAICASPGRNAAAIARRAGAEMQDSLNAALIGWAVQKMGEAATIR